MRWENGAGVGRKWHQAETSVVALALKAGLSRSLELPQHQETKRRPGRGISATVLTPVSQTPPAFLQLYAGLSWSPQPDFYI
jgi:hypothetical protein